MTSQVGICNIALTRVGAKRITSLADTSESAQALTAVYDALLDAELSEHPWQFAIARVALPAQEDAPPFEWARAFPMPADFLKLVRVGRDWCFYGSDCPTFTLEGNAVLTDDASPLSVQYVRRVANPGSFSPMFVQAFAIGLAMSVCERLTQNGTKRADLIQEHEMVIRKARRSNDIQLPPQRAPIGSWELAMYGGAG